MRLIVCAMIAVTFLAACENKGLRQVTSRGNGPDEFIVVPSKPLQQPESFTALPTPTPGGSNLTDQRPLEDSIAALGGRATSPNAPVPGSDGALVNHASRFGREANIRATLAEADAAFRKRQARFTRIRLVRQDFYNEAYRRESLNPGRTAEQFRRAGIPTPNAPPPGRRRR
ncbi:DUF3035 domain-containing protein [uncultured Tateyamaria sp.]|uniref:DUF3035 domain-containing protein n=1 Tax=uncultured Tateyamaria sp. TaxID=455651 RepID=UPI0026265B7E|nr:DUF3035 domain-containing protein [uncultured Tateyamaria sp.]